MTYLPYKITKNGAVYQVIAISSGIVQFTSLKRSNCSQWISNNTH
jgi:hypothetical protein